MFNGLKKFHKIIALEIYLGNPGFNGYDEAALKCYKLHLTTEVNDLEKLLQGNKEDIENKINELEEELRKVG